MRFINKHIKKSICCFLTVVLLLSLCGCGSNQIEIPYDINNEISLLSYDSMNHEVYDQFFADSLCVVTNDIDGATRMDTSADEAACLFDLDHNEVLLSKNAHERLYPASLTKVMTALVAIKYGALEQTINASDVVNITEKGAQVCGIKSGDSMTLEQALYLLLLYSANDVAMMIAENVGGSVDHFIEMMNEEAIAIGATNTHFVNPHGLTNEDHYTTAYDLYLIMQEAVKYDQFNTIINSPSCDITYLSASGASKDLSVKSTNGYVKGERNAPEGVVVVGGKTGTTAAAGHCLILYVTDQQNNRYISVILKSESTDSLYKDMSNLLSEITN